MAAAHTDSPTFKIKHNPEKKAGPYVQLSTEKYGGMLMGTWFDRPLSVAGRVVTAKDGKLETKLVDVNRDLLVIPSVAIHMNRAANDGIKLMANVDTLPLYGMQEAAGSFPRRRGCGCGREGGRDPRRGSEPVFPHARDGLWREGRICARAAAG